MKRWGLVVGTLVLAVGIVFAADGRVAKPAVSYTHLTLPTNREV